MLLKRFDNFIIFILLKVIETLSLWDIMTT